jgi:hypothetical protein
MNSSRSSDVLFLFAKQLGDNENQHSAAQAASGEQID